jgi:hypothetical protein
LLPRSRISARKPPIAASATWSSCWSLAEAAPAAGNNKPATVETGYTLSVPSFVEEGDLIQIDTRTGAYVTRVKE